jgi:acetyl esterase/lipase
MNRIILGALLLIAAGCLHATPPPLAKVVRYVDNGLPDQVMDTFWPSARPTAAVLFIHGGSLQEGGERRNDAAYRNVCVPFVRAAIACASMDYRLAPAHRWPAMPEDVASALAVFRKLAVAHGVDPKTIFLFGHSSGCHLAAIVATNQAYLETAGLQPSDLAGVIAMGCTLDREDAALRRLTAEQIRTPFRADPVEVATYGTPETWLAANPASFIGAHVPPTLVLLAAEERFAPPVLEQGARFVRRLREEGVAADLVIVPGTHMSSIASLRLPDDPAFKAILRFIGNPNR